MMGLFLRFLFASAAAAAAEAAAELPLLLPLPFPLAPAMSGGSAVVEGSAAWLLAADVEPFMVGRLRSSCDAE